jgi:hypothetical protein
MGLADELKKLAELRDAGVVSQDEFEAEKARLIGEREDEFEAPTRASPKKDVAKPIQPHTNQPVLPDLDFDRGSAPPRQRNTAPGFASRAVQPKDRRVQMGGWFFVLLVVGLLAFYLFGGWDAVATSLSTSSTSSSSSSSSPGFVRCKNRFAYTKCMSEAAMFGSSADEDTCWDYYCAGSGPAAGPLRGF